MDEKGAQKAIEAFLRALGHEPVGDLATTPATVAQAWCHDLLEGYQSDPVTLLEQGAIPTDQTGLVVLRNLQVTMMCPHHLLPATGTADVFYLPSERIAGFGVVVRALRALTRRLVLQEATAGAMTQALLDGLQARAAGCRLRMRHSCLAARGVREAEATVETLSLAGSFGQAGTDRELALLALASPAVT